jgi:hypothetical protein
LSTGGFPSSTRVCISFAGLNDCGTPVQPLAATGSALSYWTPNAVMFAGMSAGDV